MRTGAIFARGSCRALKWMALFGVVFALGAGITQAQTDVSATATFDPGASSVTLSWAQAVYGPVAAAAFTVEDDGDSVDVSSVSAGSAGSPSTQVTLTLAKSVASGSVLTVAYDEGDAGDEPLRINATDPAGKVNDLVAVTATENDITPVLPTVDDITVVLGTAQFERLPEATTKGNTSGATGSFTRSR